MATKDKTPLDSRINLFKFDLGKNKDLTATFGTLYAENKGDWSTLKTELTEDKGFSKEVVKNLNFTHALSDWSKDNTALVKIFQKDKTTYAMRDIALHFNKAQFTRRLIRGKAIPVDTDIVAEQYAATLHNELFHIEPTAVVQNMVQNPKQTLIADPILRGGIDTFLNNQDEAFNIKTTSIYTAFKQENAFEGIAPELHEGIKTTLKTVQRVTAISPVAEAIPVLMKANMHTAYQVSDMSEGQFIQAFKGALGENGEAIAQALHTNAVNVRIRNEHALIALKEAKQGTGIAFIDKSLNAKSVIPTEMNFTTTRDITDASEKHNLNWDLLFGDADFCECGECTSVYSAAAYFVELLQYLRNNNLELAAKGTIAINSDPKKIDGTPLEKLLDRRPDLGCLELTCANTNTILPYVDLVNEVMESYVVFQNPKPFNVADETSGELLAAPQHTEYQAYEILKDKVYPFTLPYHQPIDAARINLEFLGTSRTELMDTFRSPREATPTITNPNELALLDKFHEAYINRAVDAEYLGLTQEEYVILTQEDFVSKKYWEEQYQIEHTLDDYHTKIGVKSVHEYYGYTNGDMLDATTEKGLTYVKKQFLPRTGIEYTDLVALLKTQCLNPNMPKGKALKILNNIRLSYRYLQSLVPKDSNVPRKTKYEQLLAVIRDFHDDLADSGDPCKVSTEVTLKDLYTAWAKTYPWSDFKRLGKLTIADVPSVVSWGLNRIDVFVQSTDNGALYTKSWDGSTWSEDTPFGDLRIVGKPSVVSWGPNRIDVFVQRANDGGLYTKSWDGSTWSDYTRLVEKIRSAPIAVSWGPNRIDVFAKGADNNDNGLYTMFWDGSTWSDYTRLIENIESLPSVISWAPNRIDVFVRGEKDRLYTIFWDGSKWSEYTRLGNEMIKGTPSAVSWGPNRIDVFVQGTDDRLYTKFWNGTIWSNYTPLDVLTIKGIPAVVSWEPNRLDIFVQGTSNALYTNFWDGSTWSSFTAVTSERIVGSPSVVSWGPNRMDIFVQDAKSALSTISYSRSEDSVDLEKWVYDDFEKIGKMIVLENGNKCVKGSFPNLMSIKNTAGDILRIGKIVINNKCEIIFNGVPPYSSEIILIGQIDCATGTLIGGTYNGQKIDFSKNIDEFKSSDGRVGHLNNGVLLEDITNAPFVALDVAEDTCNLDTVRLIHLDGTPVTVDEYDHIHRFIRLWRKTGWTIDEVDKSLTLQPNCAITPPYLHQLSAVKKLLDKTGLELTKLLTFWTDISTVGEKPLYKRLFLTHNLSGMDTVFKADKNGHYLMQGAKISDHVPVIMAAFNLSADDVEAIIKDKYPLVNAETYLGKYGKEWADIYKAESLTLANLSLLYRYRLLSRTLGLRIPAFIAVLPLFGNPFTDANVTLEWLERWGKMEDAGFTHQVLNYLIRNVDDEKKPFAPSEKAVMQLAKTLYDGLNAIDEAHKDLVANTKTTDATEKQLEIQAQATTELVRSKATVLFDPSVVEQISGILEGTSVFMTKAPVGLTAVSDKLNPQKDLPNVTVSDVVKTLRKKIKYSSHIDTNNSSNNKANIQVTGILTAIETTELKTWSNNLDWNGNGAKPTMMDRIENQQNKLFKDVLYYVFLAEKTISATDKTKLEAIIKSSDIYIPLSQLEELVNKLKSDSLIERLTIVVNQLATDTRLTTPIGLLQSLIKKMQSDSGENFQTLMGELEALLDGLKNNPTVILNSSQTVILSNFQDFIPKLKIEPYEIPIGQLNQLLNKLKGNTTESIKIPIDQLEELVNRVKNQSSITINTLIGTNSAPQKRVAFLTVFLPYLRQELTRRFVVDTLSNSVGLERATTDVLISEVLMLTPSVPIRTVFEKIKDSAKPTSSSWTGYLIPAAEGDYTFIVKNYTFIDNNGNPNPLVPPSLSIEGMEPFTWMKQEDPTDEWWAKTPIKLQAGKLYKLSTAIDLKNVYWKTATSAISAVPPSVLLPDFASKDCKPAFVLLKKAALLVTGFNLSKDEILYINTHKADFDNLYFDFNADENPPTDLEFQLKHWLRLEAYTRLRNALPETQTNILSFFNWTSFNWTNSVQDLAEKAKLSAKISELTLWKKERIDKLITAEHFNLNDITKFRNEKNLLKLQNALSVADKIGMDMGLLFDWAKPTSNFKKCRSIADSIEKAIRAQYNQTDWEQVVKPLSDKLRNNQKEALIGYLLQQPELKAFGVTDADGLFEYFLIDVQMDACMETSRIKQALSSVQLFVMRCFLGLESKKDASGKEIGVGSAVLDRGRWNWMERYRVWEANRKVFLYPENWIESNLRDDKSPFFKELESELLQKDINKQNITDALKAYLYKVDEVANMEVVGLYIEGTRPNGKWTEGAKLHVFARTRNAPYFFYYRYLALDEMNWYAWEKMQVEIPSYDVEDPITHEITRNGCYLTPVVWNDRLLIFFPQFMKKTKPNESIGAKAMSDIANDSPNNSKPTEYWEIKMAWSEYRNGKWTQKQLSKDAVYDVPTTNGSNIGGDTIAQVFEKARIGKENAQTAWTNVTTVGQKTTVIANSNLIAKAQEVRKWKLHFDATNQYDAVRDTSNAFKLVDSAKATDSSQMATDANTAATIAIGSAFTAKNDAQTTFDSVKGFRDAGRAIAPNAISDISKYKFVPKVSPEAVNICVDNNLPNSIDFWKIFAFDGSKLSVTLTGISKPNLGIMTFHKISGGLQSLQFDPANRTLEFKENGNKPAIYDLQINSADWFYHPYTNDLLGKINTGQLEAFFKFNTDASIDKADAFGENGVKNYHELKRPYSLYNWELFFHTPMMLADALSKAQQFEEAMKWYHFVFSPMADGTDDKRFWQFSPFKDINSQRILDSIFNGLQPNTADKTINAWRNNPFMPHLVARDRPVAYMKWVVMKYIDNLVAWGDYLFRQDTIESINQATQLYVLAGHILGKRPMMIPKRGKTKPQTYLGLLDKWDAFGNAMVELELVAPYSNQISTPMGNANGVAGFANIFGFSTALYFCIPNNPKLMGYWDTVGDRLFKIRHCQNIEGLFRKLPLFEPPIDPALLVKAAAQGLSIASVLNDLNTPMPNYRFYYLLQKALELCNELKSLGGAMLSAIEKKDNEAIALIRAKHESTMHNLVMEVKKLQLEEAQKSLETLQQNRKSPEHRMKYYLQLIGEEVSKLPTTDADFTELANSIEKPVDESGLRLSKFEKEDVDKANLAALIQFGIGSIETLGSISNILPSLSVNASPLGVGGSVSFGGSNIGAMYSSLAKAGQTFSNFLSYQSSHAAKKGGFQHALQDRIFQANAAGYEIKQIDKQITAQEIRIQMANLEISNQQKQIDNAQEVEEFLKSKYTNDELYTWMRGSLKTLYHQVYSLAYDLAKKAEKTYRFERGLSNANFIQSGYWDAGRDGLLAGEQLYVGLKQLEAAYQENRGYDYEITKHISLRQINPLAVLQLRETGKCEFMLPEVLFDMDFSGHFKRRIKSVSLSIPCVAGPYTNINGTLRLLENKFRNTAIVGKSYEEKTDETDERFSTYIIPISAIATSSGQNDSGVFELNFKDERYLPFEGAGVTSKWRLELPQFHQFDYNTISDVVVHLRYMSNEGGERLKKAAYDSAQTFMASVEDLGRQEGLFSIIDLQHYLPTEWRKAMKTTNTEGKHVLTIPDLQQFLPFYTTAFVKKSKFEIADKQFVHSSEITAISLTETAGLKNKEIKFTATLEPIQKAFMVIRFILKK